MLRVSIHRSLFQGLGTCTVCSSVGSQVSYPRTSKVLFVALVVEDLLLSGPPVSMDLSSSFVALTITNPKLFESHEWCLHETRQANHWVLIRRGPEKGRGRLALLARAVSPLSGGVAAPNDAAGGAQPKPHERRFCGLQPSPRSRRPLTRHHSTGRWREGLL
jgi:hypothetical protein